jgi:sugar phosphate isomerase/epimerase
MLLKNAGAAALAATLARCASAADAPSAEAPSMAPPANAPSIPTPAARSAQEPFGYSLNTSTVSGANLGIVKEMEIAAGAGYSGIEPWMSEIHAYIKKGGAIDDLRKRAADLGLTVVDVIGFDEWVVDDEARRNRGLEQMKRDLDLVAKLGGKHMAAPPAGANAPIDLDRVADRYRVVLELGRQFGVSPLLEFWGTSPVISRLSQVAYAAVACGRRDASILVDLFHVYKGGSDFNGLTQISCGTLHVIHVNDYPANPPRAKISDSYRVYPGDGIAPLGQIFRDLRDGGFKGYLSLELFNRDYWRQSPVKVARLGIEKTRAAVRAAMK